MRSTLYIEEKRDRKQKNNDVVFKKKGKGNRYFNAFCLKYIAVDIKTGKGQLIETYELAIAFRDSNGNEKINSSLTMLIYKVWGSCEVNSKYSRGQHIVHFLNWLLKNRHHFKQLNSLAELNIEMLKEYLNSYSYEVDSETFNYAKHTLLKLYMCLATEGLLKFVSEECITEDILNDVRQATYKNRKVIHRLPEPLIPIMIQVCELETPDIALGVAKGILSGTRVSELTNLSRDAVSFIGQNDFKLDIRNRNIKKVSSPRVQGKVKVPRNQRVYNEKIGGDILGVDKLKDLYEKHIKMYTPKDGSNALFVDKNGNAMSSETFSRRFRVFKRKFIEKLESSSDPVMFAYADFLKKKKWATHIMRGIFSNLYAERCNNVKDLQFARGDKSSDSSDRYISDTDRIAYQGELAIQGRRREVFKRKPLPITQFKPQLEVKDEML